MNEESRTNKSKKRDKTIVAVIFALCIIVAVCYILIEYTDIFAKKENDSPTSMYSDKLYSYVFYPTNFDLDVTADAIYMGLDRQIYYKNGGLSYSVSENDSDISPVVRFFVEYFKTVIAGDTETYNTYFTDSYYKTNKPYVQFAPQMLYNIEVEELGFTASSDGTTRYSFYVTYMIHRNDGTFRNDIESDASKTLYYELIEYADGTVKIDMIDRHKYYN